MQHLDALEGLPSHGFTNEAITSERYEIQRFFEGFRDPALRCLSHPLWNLLDSPRDNYSKIAKTAATI